MRIAHIVPSLEDRHGGPSRSVRGLADAMARQGPTVELLATGTPDASSSVAASALARVRTFPREFPRFLTRSPELEHHVEEEACDVLHNHALWLLPLRYASRAARIHRAPLVISPRGMLSDWAYRHRRWKKIIAQTIVHPGALRSAAGWHATSQEEANDIRRRGFDQPVCVAPNGVEIPTDAELAAGRAHWSTRLPGLRGRRVALFYSRLHRKKRVRELIDLWLAEPRGDWVLLVVGVPEEYGVLDLQAAVRNAHGNDGVFVADGTAAPPPYGMADMFLLPSHSENFGLVVAEALAAGVPALVTNTTPWHRLQERAAGACVPWDRFALELRTVMASPASTLRAMGEQGRAWMREEFNWDRAAATLISFYASLRR